MPIVLRRKDGSLTPFRNIEYLPFYYFIPRSFLACCGEELHSLPRNPQQLVMNRAACEIVESDLFLLLIIDAAAYMVWPHMGFSEYMEMSFAVIVPLKCRCANKAVQQRCKGGASAIKYRV